MISLALIEDDLIIQESLQDYFDSQNGIQLLKMTRSVEDFLLGIKSKALPQDPDIHHWKVPVCLAR